MERFDAAAYLAKKMSNGMRISFLIEKEKLLGISEPVAHNRGGSALRIVSTEEEALDWMRQA
jgi:hypothetical protein